MLNFLIAIIVDAYAHVKLTIEVQGMLAPYAITPCATG